MAEEEFVAEEGQQVDAPLTEEQEEMRNEIAGRLLDILEVIDRGIADSPYEHALIEQEEQLHRETLLKALLDFDNLIGLVQRLPLIVNTSYREEIQRFRSRFLGDSVTTQDARHLSECIRRFISVLYPGSTSSHVQAALRNIPPDFRSADWVVWKNLSPEEREELIISNARALYEIRYLYGDYPERIEILGLTGDKTRDDAIIRNKESELQTSILLQNIEDRVTRGAASAEDMRYKKLVARLGTLNLFGVKSRVEEGGGTKEEKEYAEFIHTYKPIVDIDAMRERITRGIATNDEILFYKLSTNKRRTIVSTTLMARAELFRSLSPRLRVLSDYANTLGERTEWLRRILKKQDAMIGKGWRGSASNLQRLQWARSSKGVGEEEIQSADRIIDGIFSTLFPDVVVNNYVDRKLLEERLGISTPDSFFENLEKHSQQYVRT